MSMYIYKMPYGKHLDLQRILDINEQWKDLAKSIGTFTQEDIAYIALDMYKPSQSPTNHLLVKWGQSNPTVMDLFRHLKAINNKRAMNVLRGLVPDECFRADWKERKANTSDHYFGVDKKAAVADTSELPSSPKSSIQHGSEQGVPPGTPVPPYQSQLFWKNGQTKQPTQSDDCYEYFSGHFTSAGQDMGPSSMNNPGSLHDAVLDLTPKFTEEELWIATDNFSKRNEIGHGASGIVYYGELKRLRQKVAVKVLKQEYEYELEALCRCRHKNIIQLLGYCQSDVNSYLVYDFMKNGTLLDRLLCVHGTKPLSWTQREKILIGAAKAVCYLHNLDPPILHGDIKSPNILLDSNFEAKVADFGFAKQANSGQYTKVTHVSQRNRTVHGSPPYLPDEYLEDYTKLRKEVDTYSFGIVVFETCLGVKASDATKISNGQCRLLKDLMNDYRNVSDGELLESKFKDPLCQNWPRENWLGILRTGFRCTVSSWRKRPSMDKVLDDLKIVRSDTKKSSHPQAGDHVGTTSSSSDVVVSYSSELHNPHELQCQNLPVDELKRMNIAESHNTEGEALMSAASLEKVGKTSRLNKTEAENLSLDLLKSPQEYPGTDSVGDESNRLLYNKESNVKNIMPETGFMKEVQYCDTDSCGLYCPKKNSIGCTQDEASSISSDAHIEQKKNKKLPEEIQVNRTETDSTLEEDITEESLDTRELKQKQKKKVHPLLEKYRQQKTELNKRSSELTGDMPPVRQAEPVEHVQSVPELESLSYDGRCFQDPIPVDQCQAQAQSVALYPNENAFSVVTSGMPPTPSLTSPPHYQVARH